jgi:hypothetical protein
MLQSVNNSISAPVRKVTAKVELYNGSTLAAAYNSADSLKSVDIERVGDSSKFFGFGICQKANIKLVDVARAINITTADSFKAYFKTTEAEYVNSYPLLYVTEVNRDENTNELSITVYDRIKKADEHTIAEIELNSYTVQELAAAIATFLGLNSLIIIGVADTETCFSTSYAEGANFEGTETLRAVLNAIAEVTQTVYYIDGNNNLVFKRLSISGPADLTIDKEQYITLESSTNRRLIAITHATELGDNITATLDISGTTQYIRNNPFWELREDIASLVENALSAVSGLVINQFTCKWRGNYLLEPGDKIALVTKDNNTVISYVLNDVISYNGTLSAVTEWSYTESDNETESNPSNLGEAIKQTIAQVDKVNKKITMLVSDIDANKENISTIQATTNDITAKVSSLEKASTDVNNDIAAVRKEVETKLTDEAVSIKISEALSNGVDKVETSTGVKVDKDGLTVSKSDSELATNISHDGMKVEKNGSEVLTADSTGVNAANLHATTYLIIGKNSRLEDYLDGTGLFYIGGN